MPRGRGGHRAKLVRGDLRRLPDVYLTATVRYADGTPVVQENASLSLTLQGTGFFIPGRADSASECVIPACGQRYTGRYWEHAVRYGYDCPRFSTTIDDARPPTVTLNGSIERDTVVDSAGEVVEFGSIQDGSWSSSDLGLTCKSPYASFTSVENVRVAVSLKTSKEFCEDYCTKTVSHSCYSGCQSQTNVYAFEAQTFQSCYSNCTDTETQTCGTRCESREVVVASATLNARELIDAEAAQAGQPSTIDRSGGPLRSFKVNGSTVEMGFDLTLEDL